MLGKDDPHSSPCNWPWHIQAMDWFKSNVRKKRKLRFHLRMFSPTLKLFGWIISEFGIPSYVVAACLFARLWSHIKVHESHRTETCGISMLAVSIMNNKDMKHGKWWYKPWNCGNTWGAVRHANFISFVKCLGQLVPYVGNRMGTVYEL